MKHRAVGWQGKVADWFRFDGRHDNSRSLLFARRCDADL
jgi:hypothetical protein